MVKFPEITFFVQEVEVPAVNLGVAIQSSSVHEIPIPGETMDYSPLQCTFIVDEQMKNYKAIHNWIMRLGYPEGHQLYRDLMADKKNEMSPSELASGYTDGNLTILGNSNRPIATLEFVDCFPTSLSGLNFSSTNSDSSPLTATVTFEYSFYRLKAYT